MPSPEQQRYEVRFDWGVDGLEAIAPGAGAIVLVDVLPPGDERLVAASAAFEVPVLAAGLHDPVAVARWILARQAAVGDRLRVAVVATGARRGDGIRFAVEDLLAAGAVVDALAEVGIDFCSPEAASASASFVGLRRAAGHLVSASVAAQSRADGVPLGAVAELGDADDARVLHDPV